VLVLIAALYVGPLQKELRLRSELAAGRTQVATLTTLDYHDVDAGIDKWLAVSTGGLRDELAATDAAVLLVDHDAFDPEAIVAHCRYVLDARAWLPRAKHVERL
jgi:hypothetical protein